MDTPQIRQLALKFMDEVSLDGRHQYRDKNDKLLAGVTTVSGMLKQDWAIPYGAKEAVKALGYFEKIDGEENLAEWERLQEIQKKITDFTPFKFWDFLHESKSAYAKKSKEAKQVGTDGHQWVEDYVKAVIRQEPIPDYPKDFLEAPLKELVLWFNENVKEFILSESRLRDEKNEVAGTLDILALMNDDTYAVIDVKFANNLGVEYYLQTAEYAKMLIDNGVPVTRRILLRIPKTEYLTKFDDKKWVYVKVENKFEVHEIKTDLNFDVEAFLHLREAFKWLNYAKKYI